MTRRARTERHDCTEIRRLKESLAKFVRWLSDHGSRLLWTFVAAVLLDFLAVRGWPERGPACC